MKSVLNDLAKVVIDYPKNKKASTGGFEIVYKAKNEVLRPKGNMGCDLKVEGRQMMTSMFQQQQTGAVAGGQKLYKTLYGMMTDDQ